MAWIRKIKENFYVYERKNGVELPPRCAGKSYGNALNIKRTMEDQKGFDTGLSDKMTVQNLYDDYLIHCKKIKAPSTVDHIEDHLAYFLKIYKTFKLSEFTRQHAKAYKKNLLVAYSVNGMNIKLAAVKAMFAYAVEQEWLFANPFMLVKKEKPVKVGRALTLEEFALLMEKGNPGPELRDILIFAVYTGLRVGELVNLKKEAIWNYFAHIEKVSDGTKKEKVVPIPEPARYVVDRVVKGPIFKGWSTGRIRWAFKRCVDRAKRDGEGKLSGRVRFHDLRHTSATWAILLAKMPLEVVQGYMGHSSIKTTKDTYGHLSKHFLMENMAQIDYKIK